MICSQPTLSRLSMRFIIRCQRVWTPGRVEQLLKGFRGDQKQLMTYPGVKYSQTPAIHDSNWAFRSRPEKNVGAVVVKLRLEPSVWN